MLCMTTGADTRKMLVDAASGQVRLPRASLVEGIGDIGQVVQHIAAAGGRSSQSVELRQHHAGVIVDERQGFATRLFNG